MTRHIHNQCKFAGKEVWHLWEINLIDCDDAHEKYGVSAIIEKGSVNKSSNILLVL